MADLDPNTFVRCHACSAKLRASGTEVVRFGEYEEEQRWCKGCIQLADEYTEQVAPNDPPQIEEQSGITDYL